MELIIRPATPNDLPTLLNFEQSLINSERHFDETMIPEEFHYYNLALLIENPEAEVLVAELDRIPVASGHVRIMDGDNYNQFERFAFLGFMYVEPEHRGKGINQMIISALINWASDRGLKECRLQVYDENIVAIRAYGKSGFKRLLTTMRLKEK